MFHLMDYFINSSKDGQHLSQEVLHLCKKCGNDLTYYLFMNLVIKNVEVIWQSITGDGLVNIEDERLVLKCF